MTALRDTPPPRQLPLELGHAPALSRDDLIVSAANAEAVALIDRWPDWPSAVTVLAGPTGSGKSHIASIWREMSGATAVGPQALSEAVEAAAKGAVLIDAVDSAPIDEAGLFHLINAARQAGTHLLLTSRRFPGAWGLTLPDLTSRLKTAATVEIGEPDDALLSGVVTKLFADRQIEVEPHVVQFIVRRIERSLSAAIDVVGAIDRTALETKSRISRALAAEVIGGRDAEAEPLAP
ncbi:DnaA regulatory inactivator HdaA [Arvimicrobium flavum]|uniref:DnaA regulatory inactivator HdaA n=1 Tax=Arvimicrobium flavum TaxID=3393320 RepID=UPI00237A0CD5|nr:DnaA regulatory inactivator HdaA [Mesorhizobium shangrilense]